MNNVINNLTLEMKANNNVIIGGVERSLEYRKLNKMDIRKCLQNIFYLIFHTH